MRRTWISQRYSEAEKTHVRVQAEIAGLTISEYVRRRALGKKVISKKSLVTINELRRLGGLLKKVHTDSGGAYSAQTAAMLSELRDAIIILGK